MRRTGRLASCLVGVGSGLLLVGCGSEALEPDAVEHTAEANQALSQDLVREVEPNDTPATAMPIGTDTVIRGQSNLGFTDADYFAFEGMVGDKVYAGTMTSASMTTSTDTILTLFQPDGTTQIEQDNDDGFLAGSASSIAGATLTQSGTHYLRVTNASSTFGLFPYDLHVRVQRGTPAAEPVEPNDMTTNPLPASGWVTGSIAAVSDVDPYTIVLNAGDTVVASVDLDPLRDNTPWNGQVLIGPFGASNTFLVGNDGSTSAQNSEMFPITVKNAGTYVVAVGSPATVTTFGDYTLSVAVHPATAATPTCTTHASTDIPKTIPTGPGNVTSTIIVPGHPRIADLDVSLNLTHMAPQDLDLTLSSPAGNVNGLATDVGGTSGTTFTNWDITFDDEAAFPAGISTLLNGFVVQPEGTFRLNWFDGEDAGGTWTLNLIDDAAANGGTLDSWSITVCEPPAAPRCAAGGTPLPIVFTTDFESGPSGFTHSGTAEEWELGLPTATPVTGCNSGTNCWKTDLDNTYNAGSIQNLVSPPIDLANRLAPARLQWAMKYQMESPNYDHMYVEVREVGGANPTRVWENFGPTMTTAVSNPSATVHESAGWGEFAADVSAYVGKQIELVFHLDSDMNVHLGGLAIDDVSVSACLRCGNGVVDAGEGCDDGNPTNGDGCDNNCTVTACGNGIPTGSETCDDGNTMDGDGCDYNCTTTRCGNGVVTMGEACDDGNIVNGDGCDNNCTATACGNGIVTMGEACDDGNTMDGDECDSNCTIPGCGNGILNAGEVCDDGNPTNGDGCDVNCTVTGCGNGIPTMGEACDDGNPTNGDGCDVNCTISACGNGIIAGTEVCDDSNTMDGDGCDSNCTVTGCGNGIPTMGEGCDDGNANNGDGCDNNCTVTGCGNGIPTGTEACDDGNPVNGDGCDSNCTVSACGNGIPAGTEACDDGNTTNGDGCDNNCTISVCGNGEVGGTEACDDGNNINGDGCDNNCTVSACGNGVTAGMESCDDGNTVDGDGCDSDCTSTGCGNGIITPPEECDDGNTMDGDGCDSDCSSTGCGNGIITPPEECDDGNTMPGDGCDAMCATEGTGGAGGTGGTGMGGMAGAGGMGGRGGAGGTGGMTGSSSSGGMAGMGGAGGMTGSSSGTGGSGGTTNSSSGAAGAAGMGSEGGSSIGGGILEGGGCACTTMGQSQSTSPYLAFLGFFGLLATKRRRRK